MKKIYSLEEELIRRYEAFCKDCYNYINRINDGYLIATLLEYLHDFKLYIRSLVKIAEQRCNAVISLSKDKGYVCAKQRLRNILDSMERNFQAQKAFFWTIFDTAEINFSV